MVKQIILPIVGVIIFIILVGLFLKKSATPGFKIPTFSQKTVTIGAKSISVEVADSNETRAKGLSGRASLDHNSGMLFVFTSKKVAPGFWMKDMQIPLDIIWISDDKVLKIGKNLPIPEAGTPDNKLIIYTPGAPFDYVLEVNAGFSDQNSIKEGDPVTLSL